ncbi:hypothetical protein C240_1858 [Enterococcus sp. 5H]|nr:hypothetical protein [Enterococcus sp. 5H]
MIVGGIGSAVYFNRAEKSMTDIKKDTYEIKDKKNTKEIHLTLSGNADFYLLSENSDQVVMNTRSSVPVTVNSSLDVKEKDNQLMISANANKAKAELKGLQFGLFDRGSSVTLTIPNTAERIIIDGETSGDITFSNTTTKDLDITLKNADISINNINSEKLSVKSDNGDLTISSDSHSDQATFESTNGDVYINDFTSSDWSVITKEGDISLDAIKGVAQIETKNGDIDAINLKGDADIKSTNGDITLTGSNIPKNLTITSEFGDINVYTDEILYDVVIKAQTNFGDSKIFGKERTSYNKGKETKSLILKTKSGDISVEGPSEYEDEQSE